MARWRVRSWRSVLLFSGAGGFLVFLGVLVAQFKVGLDEADKWASVLGAFAGVGALVLGLASYVGQRPATALTDPVGARLLDTLAERNLRVAWDAEWRRRRLHDPAPLPVAWINADELADHWQNITDSAVPCPPITLSGSFDQLAQVYTSIPSRRLVIVGAGGQGKSVLLLHLARELLARRRSGEPVPVLLNVTSWEPHAASLRDWLVKRLPLDISPALGADAGDGHTLAWHLVEGGLVTPLLDGLDELPASARGQAIRQINNAGRGPLVLACRDEHYAAAIDDAHDVLNAAAVVRLRPLRSHEIVSWLNRATPAGLARKWERLAQALSDGAHPHLGRALGLPLMTSMARTIYAETTADPNDLLDAARSEPDEIERHLLGQLVPTAFRDSPGGWAPARVGAFLAELSQHLSRQDTDRIEWWRLPAMLPRLRCLLLRAVLVGVTFWLVAAAIPLLDADTRYPVGTAVVGLLFALGTLVAGRILESRRPEFVRFSPRPNGRAALAVLRGALWRGGLAGLVIGPLVLLIARIQIHHLASWADKGAVVWILGATMLLGIVPSVLIGAGLGLVFGVPLAVADMFTAPIEVERVVENRAFVRSDRNRSLVRSLAFGLTLGFTMVGVPLITSSWTFVTFLNEFALPGQLLQPDTMWLSTPAFVLCAASGTAAFLVTNTSWGQFAFARGYLALSGRAPWRLLSLLDLARDREVLRQEGPVYRFRHERLQTHLANHR